MGLDTTNTTGAMFVSVIKYLLAAPPASQGFFFFVFFVFGELLRAESAGLETVG